MYTSQIQRIVITLNSQDASMLYFLLEANEGICFYSTLETNQPGLKSIELLFDISTQEQVEHLLGSIKSQNTFNYHRD